MQQNLTSSVSSGGNQQHKESQRLNIVCWLLERNRTTTSQIPRLFIASKEIPLLAAMKKS
jgi:hypothetical protein